MTLICHMKRWLEIEFEPRRWTFPFCSPLSYHCATLNGVYPISISFYNPYTLKNSTLFEMSISKKTNWLLEFCQSTYVVLLIKQDTWKLAHFRPHKQKIIELFQFFNAKLSIPFLHAIS